MPNAQPVARTRAAALLAGAAQWRDRNSHVRIAAREALRDGEWPSEVVELALDNVLRDADQVLREGSVGSVVGDCQVARSAVLAILPGNVLGPAIATAYCAAAAGATLMLKSSSRELCLANVVAEQFESLGPPIAGTLKALRWTGGDEDFESKIFPLASRIVVFGDDATIADVERRAPRKGTVLGYGSAYSLGYVPGGSDITAASTAAASDVALFDQRGCLSPQTIYVEGDEAKAILFAHALSGALAQVGRALPRGRAGDAEKAAVAEFIRRLMVRALAPKTHALDTVIIGPNFGGVPEFVVGVEAFSAPTCAGFGRIVAVKPVNSASQAAGAAKTLGHRLDSIGVASELSTTLRDAFADCGASRLCSLGEMQRPPLGYRPKISDFAFEDSE